MELFGGLILTQIVVFSVCAIALRQILPNSVARIIRKNSRRLDGSFSQRRKNIELHSLNNSFFRIYAGMGFIVVLTLIVSVIVIGMTIELPNLDVETGVEVDPLSLPGINPVDDASFILASVYSISTLLIAPVLIVNLYNSALSQYYTRANLRFMDYYRRESVTAWDQDGNQSSERNAFSRGVDVPEQLETPDYEQSVRPNQ